MSDAKSMDERVERLVTQLRYLAAEPRGAEIRVSQAMYMAADEIERLTRELAEEREMHAEADVALKVEVDETERLKRVIDRCGHKIKVMLGVGVLKGRAEINALLRDMTGDEITNWRGGLEWQCTCGRINAPGNTECGTCHCQPHAGCIEVSASPKEGA